MTKIAMPTTGEELQEFLGDATKVSAVFSKEALKDGTTKEFLDAHVKIRNAKDQELEAQAREQMQIVLAEFLRNNGGAGGSIPAAALAGKGRPGFTGTGPAPGTVAHKQSLYSRSSKSAQLNGAFDSFGDFLRAATQEGAGRQYRDADALNACLDKIKAIQNSFGTDVPSDGGFLIPEEFRSDLLMLALESAVIRPRATIIPMGSQTLAIPAVDDTSHATTVFGGIQTYWVDESTAPTETSGKFAQVKLDAKKLMAYCTAPSELPADAPGFAAYIDQTLPKALAFEEDYRFMAGTGVGEPLGFINCPAAIQAAGASHLGANTIGVEDLAGMYARMLPSSLMNAIWLADIGTFPQLATMAVQGAVTNSAPVWMNNGPRNSG
jgi:HK97 family phage major capsid protein